MAKYLIKATYTTDGVRGLLKDGGSKRVKAVSALLKSVGGKLDAFYFAMGDADVYAIIDAPDNVSVAAASMVINASGAVQVQSIALLSPADIDEAAKKSPAYRAPGQ